MIAENNIWILNSNCNCRWTYYGIYHVAQLKLLLCVLLGNAVKFCTFHLSFAPSWEEMCKNGNLELSKSSVKIGKHKQKMQKLSHRKIQREIFEDWNLDGLKEKWMRRSFPQWIKIQSLHILEQIIVSLYILENLWTLSWIFTYYSQLSLEFLKTNWNFKLPWL